MSYIYTLDIAEIREDYPLAVSVRGLDAYDELLEYEFEVPHITTGEESTADVEALTVSISEEVEEFFGSDYLVYNEELELNVVYASDELVPALRYLLDVDFEKEGLDE